MFFLLLFFNSVHVGFSRWEPILCFCTFGKVRLFHVILKMGKIFTPMKWILCWDEKVNNIKAPVVINVVSLRDFDLILNDNWQFVINHVFYCVFLWSKTLILFPEFSLFYSLNQSYFEILVALNGGKTTTILQFAIKLQHFIVS